MGKLYEIKDYFCHWYDKIKLYALKLSLMIEPVYSAAENRYECGMQYRRAGRSGVMLPAISLGLP